MATNVSFVQAPQTPIPNLPGVNDQAQARLNASSAYMMSPQRAMDYLAGYQAPSSTVPTAPGSTGAMGNAMAPSTGLSGNNFTGSAATPGAASGAAPQQTQPGVPGQLAWNQPTTPGQGTTPQAMAGMGQNVQSSLSGLAQLLGKGNAGSLGKQAPNPSPQQYTTQQAPAQKASA